MLAWVRLFVLSFVLLFGLSPALRAQVQPEQEPMTPEKNLTEEKEEIPAPEDITLKTRDGIDLRCTYFKAAHKQETAAIVLGKDEPVVLGKFTLPFILLHDWEGSRKDLHGYGELLQKAGCAVIIPDLRGHGESTTMNDGMKPIDLSKFRKQDFASVVNDIEACKKYLVQKNNDAELNIDLLNLIAVGRTSTPAMDWVIRDWYAFPPYKAKIKQGQDVKSLILISPAKKLNQINMNAALKHPMFSGRDRRIPNLPTLVVWSDDGSDSDSAKESRSIFETMKKGRPESKKTRTKDEQAEKETAFDVVIRSRQSGADLVKENHDLRLTIMEFVAGQVGASMDQHPWQSRQRKKE